MIDDTRSSSPAAFLRPASLIAGCLFAVALLLLPFAVGKTGSAGPLGLLIAAAICLAAAWLAEMLAFLLHRSLTPLMLMLSGMAIRMVPPLVVCLFLAARGANGRDYLAFICYLMTFYVVTLALETWLTVKRVARTSSPWNPSAR